jgi:hypothetical protein
MILAKCYLFTDWWEADSMAPLSARHSGGVLLGLLAKRDWLAQRRASFL